MGLTLLAAASMPMKFWDEAFSSAFYLINRLPTPVLHNQSPFECLFHTPPDYHSLKVFGCTCYPNLHPYNTHKLQLRSVKCTFIGYGPKHKGYKCLSSQGRVYISRDVVFDKSSFPYALSHHLKILLLYLPSLLPYIFHLLLWYLHFTHLHLCLCLLMLLLELLIMCRILMLLV